MRTRRIYAVSVAVPFMQNPHRPTQVTFYFHHTRDDSTGRKIRTFYRTLTPIAINRGRQLEALIRRAAMDGAVSTGPHPFGFGWSAWQRP